MNINTPVTESIERLEKSILDADPGLIEAAARELFGVSGVVRSLGGEKDHNFLIDTGNEQHLLKICNPREPQELLAFQVEALKHIEWVDPGLPVPRSFRTLGGQDWGIFEDRSSQQFRMRMLGFLPGTSFSDITPDLESLRLLGRTIARLDIALQGFYHPSADFPLVWDMKRANLLEPLVDSIIDKEIRSRIYGIFQRFSQIVQPVIPRLRGQIIHNDISFHNVVVDKSDPLKISGIYDFGDMIYAPLIQEVALSAAEFAIGRDRPWEVSAAIIAGFDSITPITPEEFSLLPAMMEMRLAMGIVLEQHVAKEDARSHLTGLVDNTCRTLKKFREIDQEFAAYLKSVCTKPPGSANLIAGERSGISMLERRKKVLGNADVYSYQEPVHLVQGEGVWVRDVDGKAYLDCYNNVPHVGHCHPHVVSAITRQTSTLNTNTRYLHNAIIDYSEKMISSLPEELDTCFYVSSGSEANDLAWRIAQSWSGGNMAAATDYSYHGVTDFTEKISLYAYDDASIPAQVIPLDPPDDYRGPWKRENDERGNRYAELASEKLAQQLNDNKRLAAIYVDSILSTNGIFLPAPGYCRQLASIAHRHGGLYVADEVQSGFGRLGDHMWGFQFGGFVPDIVTFGKPIANGYPMGLLVTRKEIAESFTSKHEFFSTTGGNPVACAAAMAVFEVMELEGLMNNAYTVGKDLRNKLAGLAETHPQIGDVRGSGLFVGVDLVSNRESRLPDGELANRVVNRMKNSGVLVGVDGRATNVIKIRPPMCFNEEHSIILLSALVEALSTG